jgi:hypothetical protein
LSTVLHAILDFDPPGAAGLAIRRVVTSTPVVAVVTAATFSYLKRDCGERRALSWLANLAAETGKPIALNLPDGPDRSGTIFVSPPDWTAERLQGFIAGRLVELEAMLGEVAEVRSVGGGR